MAVNDLANRFIIFENMIGNMNSVPPTSSLELELSENLSNDFDTLRHSVNLLTEARNETGVEFNPRFTSVDARLGRVKACIASVPGKIQNSNVRSHFHKTDTI